MARVSVSGKSEDTKPAMKSSGLSALPAKTPGPTTPAATKPSTTPVSDTPSESPRVVKDYDKLVEIVQNAYMVGTTQEEAKAHAARFLEAQLNIAQELSTLNIDSRMKKNGMKATRAQAYIDICKKFEKKPTEAAIENEIILDKTVNAALDLYESAQARYENLTLYLGIFKDAHIYFRGIAKDNFSG